MRHFMFKRLTNRRLAALAAFAGGFLLVANAPASLALSLFSSQVDGFSAAKPEGTVWNGVLHEARVGDVTLGEVSFQLMSLSLFTGRMVANVELAGGALIGNGRVSASLGGELKAEDATFVFDLSAARGLKFMGAPAVGSIRGDIRRAAFDKQGCRDADFDIWTDALVAPAKRLASGPIELKGVGRCEGRSVVAMLSGEGTEGAVRLNLAIAPSMDYTLNASAQPARTEVARALEAFGFRQENGSLTIAMSGVIKWLGI